MKVIMCMTMFIHDKLENLNSAAKGILHRTTLFRVSDIDVTSKINHGPQNWSKSVKLSGEHKKRLKDLTEIVSETNSTYEILAKLGTHPYAP